jgi:hypothetical protein
MTSDEKFAVAAHLYVLLRRKSGRVVDTVWLLQNRVYAQEVLRLAREQSDHEIVKLADRFEMMMFGDREPLDDRQAPISSQKYVHSLR